MTIASLVDLGCAGGRNGRAIRDGRRFPIDAVRSMSGATGADMGRSVMDQEHLARI
jgi:hypothetical protein